MFGLQAQLLEQWRAARRPSERRPMTGSDVWLLVAAAALVARSPGCSRPPTPRSRRSPGPAPRSWPRRGAPAPRRLVQLLEDPPRYLNTALLLRLLCEIAAIVLVTLLVYDAWDGTLVADRARPRSASMLVVSFVVIGVAPAHPRPPARRAGRAADRRPADGRHHDPRPAPAAADPGRQRDHPGPRLPRGPVLHRDRAARAGRPGRGLGGDRVRRAQDDPLGLRARRHHRPRGDGAAHRRGLHRAPQEPAPDACRCSCAAASPGSR